MRIKWLLAGNIIYALGQWIIIVLLTRSYSTLDLGHYFFALSLITPIALFLSLKLPNLVVTLDERLIKESNIIFARQLISFAIVFISYILYFIFFKDNTTFLLISSVLIYKVLEQNDDIRIAYLQKGYCFRDIFLIKFIRTLVYVSLVFLFSLVFEEIEKNLFFATVFYSFYWLTKNKEYVSIIPIKSQVKFFRVYIRNGVYLSLSSSISSLSSNGIKLYIGYTLGSSVLAVYGVIAYSQTAFSIIVSALGQYFLPYFVKSAKNYLMFKAYLLKSQLSIFIIGTVSIGISYYFGGSILSIVYGEEYRKYELFLTLIFISTLFKSSGSLIGTAMTSVRIYNFQLKFTIISLVLTAILIPFFIEYFGAFGAYYCIVIVSIIEWLLYILFAKESLIKKLKNNNNWVS
ncbi:hypothetical protein CXF58_01745 [Psychrobacter sp. Sarcosine-02u-2]|uniref:lipopolysaccharide biosynthesis protein n=1 Tax=Psychrobacter sp. Sarcosine-02u-2 TaxID=2058324 RepID=UPI000C7A9B2B|nr:hypothetical protein [Psychrobacter sp. Sarcosine-02u-2]PKG88823.1 hypothetical protein CXF58_01745 [Psychrobacter sp. Sarcosine-02u-2]